jgi:uncharacterized protein YjbI with pentapeptide repeats
MNQSQTPQEKKVRELARLLLVPAWRPTQRQVLWAIRITIVLSLLVAMGYPFGITPWDWAKLLIVPAVIAGGGAWFNQQQRDREMKIAQQRAQDESLQAYLDHMSDMLVPKKDQSSLYEERPPDSMRSVARARTLTVLPQLDSRRKRSVVQFLYETGLINKDRRTVDLKGADLSGGYLRHATLDKVALSNKVDLSKADLFRAYLFGADLFKANLFRVSLRNATLIEANLRDANLSRADLSNADLRRASLEGANVFCADLRKANLSGADLSRAYLKGATVSQDQLIKCKSLQGATMPNGHKYDN